jgi:hypothetical protein
MPVYLEKQHVVIAANITSTWNSGPAKKSRGYRSQIGHGQLFFIISTLFGCM